jgi:Leucine-rich repeat (LRR) protein
VPTELLDWHTPIDAENWWDVVELRKLDLSHNAFTALPEELFLPLSELATLHLGNNQLHALPASLSAISETLARVNLQRNNLRPLHQRRCFAACSRCPVSGEPLAALAFAFWRC